MKPNTSANVVSEATAILNKIVPPGEGAQGSPLVNQEIAEIFGNADANTQTGRIVECELLSASFTDEPKPKFRMVGEAKNIPQATGDFQLRGLCKIKIGALETDILLHAHTAAAFGATGKAMVRGRVGKITNGRNAGKAWLSLSPEAGFPDNETVLNWLKSGVVNPADVRP